MEVCWTPLKNQVESSNLYQFQTFVETKFQIEFASYYELWKWSIEHLADFWECILQFFKIQFSGLYTSIYTPLLPMYQCRWFDGINISYAAHIFRNKTTQHPAIIYQNEQQKSVEISWAELEYKTLVFQQFLIKKGVQMGDRVVGYLANTPEAIIAFLACNSLGAIWSCCSPDFGTESIIDRFQQIEPKLLIASKDYYYQGNYYDKTNQINEIANQLNQLSAIVTIGRIEKSEYVCWDDIMQTKVEEPLKLVEVPFQHPIWILYSSGTTGKPKALVHRTGGMLLEHYKALALHQDCKPGERYLWYSTTGWMMWNYALSSLLIGCTLCIYDGSPSYPHPTALWEFVDKNHINHFGIGASFYLHCKKQNKSISSQYSFRNLRSLGSTGSPLPADTFQYIYQQVKSDVWLISLSGGTDVCSAFVGGNPFLPVIAGEIQCRMLGAAIEAWDDLGETVTNQLGELMITQPMPCMPVSFWNDPTFEKYKKAYFTKNDNVWQHGDWIKVTNNDGVIIYGRSDATLNRDGVRIGTAEIYNAVESLNEVKDSLVVCLERKDGSFYMPLFVVLNEPYLLNAELKSKINRQLKSWYSPRHVPNQIFEVKDIPYTISGKKMEMPIKKIMLGNSVEKSISLDAMRNPTCVNEYVALAKEVREK